MAFTPEQLNQLEQGIAEGATTIQMNGRSIQYRSLEEMQRLRDTMRAELGSPAAAKGRSRVINIAGGKGL